MAELNPPVNHHPVLPCNVEFGEADKIYLIKGWRGLAEIWRHQWIWVPLAPALTRTCPSKAAALAGSTAQLSFLRTGAMSQSSLDPW